MSTYASDMLAAKRIKKQSLRVAAEQHKNLLRAAKRARTEDTAAYRAAFATPEGGAQYVADLRTKSDALVTQYHAARANIEAQYRKGVDAAGAAATERASGRNPLYRLVAAAYRPMWRVAHVMVTPPPALIAVYAVAVLGTPCWAFAAITVLAVVLEIAQ